MSELERLAYHSIDKIDRALYERLEDIRYLSNDPIFRLKNTSSEKITERLTRFKESKRVYGSLSFFDDHRIRIADTKNLHIGNQHKIVKYWEDVLDGKLSIASDIRIAEELNIPIIYFAAPVKDLN